MARDWSKYEEQTQTQDSLPSSIFSNPQSNMDWSQYEIKDDQPSMEHTSALGAGLRAAGRAPMDFAAFLGVPREKLVYPDFFHEKPYDIQYPGAKMIGQSVWPLGAFGKIAKLISASNRIKNLSNVGNITQVSQQAENAANQAKQQHENLTSKLQEIYGTAKPETLQRQANSAVKSVEELKPQTNIESFNPANRLPGATGEGFLEQANQSLKNVKTKEIEPYFGKNIEHKVNFAERIKNSGQIFKNEASSHYENIESNLKNENIELPNQRSASEIMTELKSIISEGGLGSTEAASLAKELENIGQNKIIGAKDFFSTFRSNRQLASKIRSSAYGKDAKEFDRLQEKANKLDDIADKQEALLEAAPFGKETLKELKVANQKWREVKNLEKNTLYKQIQKGRIEGKILPKLAGTEIGTSKLHEFLENDPEAMKALLGSEFAENPEAMLNVSPRVNAYIESNPALSGMKNRLEIALKKVNKATQDKEMFAKEAKRIEEGYEESVKKETVRQKAVKDTHRLMQEITAKEKAALEIRQSMLNKNMKLADKINASLKLEQVQKDLNLLKKVALATGKVAITGVIGAATMKIINKIF